MKPLTCSMDNVLASRIGDAVEKACHPDQKVGDSIDRGLIALRLLNKAGFVVCHVKNPTGKLKLWIPDENKRLR